jgi:hypothetical protein
MNPNLSFNSAFAEKMPFQSKGRKCAKSPTGGNHALELIQSSLPIFGGTSTETKSEPSSTETSTDTKKTSTDSGGSDSGGGGSETPKEITPEQFQQLNTQVAELLSQNTELKKTVEGYTAKEEEQRKANLGREESLTEDLTNAQKTIDAQDQIIKSLALINAIQGNKEYQFHDPSDVIRRLDETSYEFNVDLEDRTASVSGVENELKRIAKEADYLVVKPNGEINQEKPNPARRGTGNPPGPTPTNQSKSARRAELEAKWPVIGAGRAKLG